MKDSIIVDYVHIHSVNSALEKRFKIIEYAKFAFIKDN